VPGAQRFAAEKSIRALSVFSDDGRSDAVASAISPDYFGLASLHVADGRMLSKADSDSLAPVAVLGHQAARDLFPNGSAIGRIFKLNHVWLTVVGVLADRDLTQNQFEGVSLGLDSNRIFVPLGTGLARFRFEPMDDEVDRVLIELRDADQLNDATRILAAVLDQRHAGAGDYSVIVPQQLYEQHQKTQRIFSIVMGAIAGISLLVGGIGIMNIMLANVLERRREIGLLRAVGARQRDIVMQFLREATVICTTGALIGLLFGALLAYAIAAFAGWQVAWAPLTILLSTTACVLIGLAFSVYPARQAAALDPITAIRSE
jgi:putative ABC transport system permease protein